MMKKSWMVGVIILLFCSSFASGINDFSDEEIGVNITLENDKVSKENVIVSCQTYENSKKSTKQLEISVSDARKLLDKINELAFTSNSAESEQLQKEIIEIAKEKGLLSEDTTIKDFQPRFFSTGSDKKVASNNGTRGTAVLCNFVTAGEGSHFPIIVLPRLIPIIQLPIPRLFLIWSSQYGITSCGSYLTNTGFIAGGMQTGMALGFWGIGFSIFLPPIRAYAFFGYALFSTCSAEIIEPWPPNYAPEVSAVSPINNAIDVPVSTSELTFEIRDKNGDEMDYIVTTSPDIGSGSGTEKDGMYSVPISGLEGSEEYSWTVEVSDGNKIIIESYSFTTEDVAPIITNPNPKDGKNYVPIDLSKLSFKIEDPQGDLMDYTVETVPDIGSGSGFDVGEGVYSIDIGIMDNLIDYTWYVNATDGINWKHKVYTFKTEPTKTFNPFDQGWSYRKEITIDHSQVDGSLSNFPVLIDTIDADLKDKAQSDGDDILFMDDSGVANRLYHEIERFDSSSGELIAWVNLSDISPIQDTTFYMYYGNPTCESQHFPDAVWDSNYVAVWHLDQTSGMILDSTCEENDGINSGAECDDIGKIGNALDFECDDPDKVTVPQDSSLDLESEITIELWFKPESFKYKRGTLCTKLYGYYTNILTTGHVSVYTYWNNEGSRGKSTYMDANTPMTPEQWHHIVWTESDQGYRKIFINGILDAEGSYEASIWTDSSTTYMGHNDHNNKDRRADGILDEVRISSVSRDIEWISTGYNNQNNPLSFLSFGIEESGP